VTLRDRLAPLLSLFLKLGSFGFGGPLAHIAMMEEEAVRRRGWLDREEFQEGLAVCQMLPGPASTQLGIYIGYLRGGWVGGVLSGLAFIAPAFVILLVLSWAYLRFGALPKVGGFFYGVNPAVIGLLLWSCLRMGRSALRGPFLGALCGLVFALRMLLDVSDLILFGLAGALTLLWQGFRPPRLGTGLLAALPWVFGGSASSGAAPSLASLFLYFLKVGSVIFGGGLVLIPYIEREVVGGFGWLTTEEFLDGVALGQITPGPVVITAAFIGYRVYGGGPEGGPLAGILGSLVATAGIFLPSFIFILGAAPFLQKVRKAERVKSFLGGVNAAVVGAIGASLVPLSRVALVDWRTGVIFLAAFVAISRLKTPPWLLVLLAGGVGVLLV
jgi:chromate transporter